MNINLGIVYSFSSIKEYMHMSSKIIFEGHTGIHGFNNILKQLIVHSNRSHYIVLIRLKYVVFVLELK